MRHVVFSHLTGETITIIISSIKVSNQYWCNSKMVRDCDKYPLFKHIYNSPNRLGLATRKSTYYCVCIHNGELIMINFGRTILGKIQYLDNAYIDLMIKSELKLGFPDYSSSIVNESNVSNITYDRNYIMNYLNKIPLWYNQKEVNDYLISNGIDISEIIQNKRKEKLDDLFDKSFQ